MSRRRRSSYGSYSSSYRRGKQRKVPSAWPYLIVALLAGAGLGYFHFFAFKSLSGKITNAYTGAAMPGVTVGMASLRSAGATGPVSTTERSDVTPTVQMTTTTAIDGTFHFEKIPEMPVVTVAQDGFSAQTIDASGVGYVEIQLVPNVLSGMVLTPDGKPVAGASIISGKTRVLAGPDGKYSLKDLAGDRKLVVKAPGYLANSVQVGQVMSQNISLQPFVAKAIYINADTIATPGKIQGLLDLVDRTELNAVVIDVKADNSGRVLYASDLPIVQQLGTSDAVISDLGGLLASLKARKIYTIARLPVFWDQAVTKAKPEWALLSKKAPGQPWLSGNGTRWANPYNTDVWDYNIAIAKEVAGKGFDEIQLDFAYFPSVGELDDIDYGPQALGKKRVDAIAGFLNRAYSELSPMGTYVAVNVLAFTPFVQDDMGVGQNFDALAAQTDFICPYLYPSDYPDGFADFAHPAEHPFEIVADTMKHAATRLQGSGAKVRPWLQDFSGKVQYDAPKVRSEMDAAEQNGATGWMLWNFGNTYTEAALKAP
jgi:hypothetical protein